jgi:hypothetical protein
MDTAQMLKVSLLRSLSSKLLLGAALILMMSACASTPASLYDYLAIAASETQVWNDYMPGSKPNCNAMLRLHITNASDSEVTLSEPEIVVAEAQSMRPLRKFPAVVTINDRRVRQVRISPKTTVELAFRSPSFGLEPIDTAIAPRVRIAIRMNSSLGLPLHFRSPITDIFETH